MWTQTQTDNTVMGVMLWVCVCVFLLPALTLLVAVVVVATVAEAISFTVNVFETDFRSRLRL